MKSNQHLKKITLLVSGIAVFAFAYGNAADTSSESSDKTTVTQGPDDSADGVAVCPYGQARGTRKADCLMDGNGHHGKFARGEKGNNGNGNCQGRMGIGAGRGPGSRAAAQDGSCLLNGEPGLNCRQDSGE